VLSSFFAARFASMIDPFRLRVAFALFLVALGAYFSWQLRARADTRV
jgi:uncharacterized membrane protein YfcA